ncbi:hypothetical protein M899_1686 [Bacteriovorax sp. BSW11_IV]|uniref:hypothetical protein n=1 Tax=Bacteriovorax sp. BSW11_IV TaxID=1353529 RepID=UPI00038A2BA4|nr:hypothetical protein [Bacteriovorax sp. BSW11_IV]EQC49441.1 hypothetical protein M899_1686 [Bacteriovorax sp. BSW11_IV]
MFNQLLRRPLNKEQERGVLCSTNEFMTTIDMEILSVDEKTIRLEVKDKKKHSFTEVDLRFYDHKNVIQFKALNQSSEDQIVSIDIENLEKKQKKFLQKLVS